MSSPEISILPHRWLLHVGFNQLEIGSVNINHPESRSPSALPVPISTKTLQVVLPAYRIRPLASPRRPHRQLGVRTAHRPASTFTKSWQSAHLGIMIEFLVLLDFALTTLGI